MSDLFIESNFASDSSIVKVGERTTAIVATPQTQHSIKNLSSRHFEKLLPTIPNTLFSFETSSHRYIQLQSIGELSEYPGAPYAPVDKLINDIDFSGIYMLCCLLNVKQVGVLRDPLGASYGANALAYHYHLYI